MGSEINHFFESKMQWSYDNGIFYINGRDIICVITGILFGIVLVMFIFLIEEWIKCKKENKDV